VLNELLFESAVAVAVRAPAEHNTQPWLVRRVGDREELRSDLSRALPVEDPEFRELHLSCGAALRHLVLGLRANGLETAVELLPNPADPQLLAVVTVTGARDLTLPESRLLGAVWTRHTDRSVFSDAAVPQQSLQHLASVAEAEGCHFDVLAGDDALLLAVLGSRAERALELDDALAGEQRHWTTRVPMPTEGVPATDTAGRGADVPLRRFAPDLAVVLVDGTEPPVPERPVLAVLSTDTDTPRDWLSGGWTLSDLLLTLEAEHLAASPLTQVLELAPLRAQLTGGLGLQGHPQVVLRIGVPATGGGPPVTARRPVGDVLLRS
jgi:hypothetical protein